MPAFGGMGPGKHLGFSFQGSGFRVFAGAVVMLIDKDHHSAQVLLKPFLSRCYCSLHVYVLRVLQIYCCLFQLFVFSGVGGWG